LHFFLFIKDILGTHDDRKSISIYKYTYIYIHIHIYIYTHKYKYIYIIEDILGTHDDRKSVSRLWMNRTEFSKVIGKGHPLYILTHVYECVLSKLYNSMKHFINGSMS
jgi:hypothetical protein